MKTIGLAIVILMAVVIVVVIIAIGTRLALLMVAI